MSKIFESRTTFKPMAYPWAYDVWRKHEQMHWLVEEIEFVQDLADWRKLTDREKRFLTNIFRFFTQSDIDVAGGYIDDYLPVFKHPELRMMMGSFVGREAVHIAAYSHVIETLGLPESTYNEFFRYPEMVAKHTFLTERDDASKYERGSPEWVRSVVKSLALFSAFTEGVQLFSSFIMLLNFARHGKMRGMGQVIAWSIRDETEHYEAMIKIFRTVVQENPHVFDDKLKAEIYRMAEIIVELEDAFVDIAFAEGDMEGLTAAEVKLYIRYITDRRLIALGLKGINGVKKNPLTWVEGQVNAVEHTNFFENKSTAYSKGTLKGKWDNVWAKRKDRGV